MLDETVISHLSADRPITSLRKDLLGRGDFSISLANAIQNWEGEDSLVLGLYGPWGHGKTSIKNFVLELLRKAENSPAVIEFNPWNWTGEDRIQAAFFEEVGVALGKDESEPDREQLALKWKKYATRLTLGGTALEHLRTAAEVAGIPWAPLILGSLSNAVQTAGSVSDQASQAHSVEVKVLDQTAEALKKTLHEALADLKHPVLVVMDDIDRLTKEEIRLLFRIIKSNADFPNIIYLLLFDRDVVENALEKVTGSNGREYMEKIVQAGFALPKVHQADIDHVLASGLDKLLQYEGIAEGFDSDRWQNFYRDALQPFFQSLRDVRRFLSTFSFGLGLFYREKSLDINFIDLIGLEVLRVFEPELYISVAKSKENLIRTAYEQFMGSDENEDIITGFKTLLEKSHINNLNAAEQILRGIFPKIDWALKNHGYGRGFEDKWVQEQRACHHEFFDRYFIMSIPKGEIRLSLVKEILAITKRDELSSLLRKLHTDGILESAIERLEAYKNTLNITHAHEFVTGLLDIDDIILFDAGMSFGMSTEFSLYRLINHYILQEKDKSTRSKLMVKCLRDCNGVWFPVRFVALQEQESDEKNLDRLVFNDDGLKDAKYECLSKMKNSNLEGIDGLKLSFCLFRWNDWAGIEEPRIWCAQQVVSLAGALRILRAFLHTSYASYGSETIKNKFINIEYLEKFTEIEVLKETLSPLLTDTTDEYDEYRSDYETEIEAFKRVLQDQEEGKGDDSQFDDE